MQCHGKESAVDPPFHVPEPHTGTAQKGGPPKLVPAGLFFASAALLSSAWLRERPKLMVALEEAFKDNELAARIG